MSALDSLVSVTVLKTKDVNFWVKICITHVFAEEQENNSLVLVSYRKIWIYTWLAFQDLILNAPFYLLCIIWVLLYTYEFLDALF